MKRISKSATALSHLRLWSKLTLTFQKRVPKRFGFRRLDATFRTANNFAVSTRIWRDSIAECGRPNRCRLRADTQPNGYDREIHHRRRRRRLGPEIQPNRPSLHNHVLRRLP